MTDLDLDVLERVLALYPSPITQDGDYSLARRHSPQLRLQRQRSRLGGLPATATPTLPALRSPMIEVRCDRCGQIEPPAPALKHVDLNARPRRPHRLTRRRRPNLNPTT